jgi:hypothetical protein
VTTGSAGGSGWTAELTGTGNPVHITKGSWGRFYSWQKSANIHRRVLKVLPDLFSCGLLFDGLLPPQLGGCEGQGEQNLLGDSVNVVGGACIFTCRQLIAQSYAQDITI